MDGLYECNGPFIFGVKRNRYESMVLVCCHGWNCKHFLRAEKVTETEHLISCGVITHPTAYPIQKVFKVE